MCRNIKTLFNFEPPATDAEVQAAALQFVRKLSGFNAPSRLNQAGRTLYDKLARHQGFIVYAQDLGPGWKSSSS